MLNTKAVRRFALTLTAFYLFLSLCACDWFGSPISLPEAPAVTSAPEEAPVDAVPLEEPRVILDYSKYEAVDDPEYYKGKYMGEIFIIKDYKTTGPVVNTLTVYGKIPFVIHPDNDLSLLDFKDPNQPVILTGYGEGWGKVVTHGEGHSALTGAEPLDIYVECTSEIKAEFRLVGGFYPAPSCILDVDIITNYFSDSDALIHCVYSNGMEFNAPIASYLDMFTDVKLPIDFHIPDQYVTRFAKTENNITYDLSYYLLNFLGKPPAKSPQELQLIFGDIPPQIFTTGCDDVHLELGVVKFPEDSEWTDNPPSVWDMMLTPESQR